MRKLKFFLISIKNNLREMPQVIGLLSLNILFTFLFASFATRLFIGNLADAGQFEPEFVVYLAIIVLTLVVSCLIMLHTYSYYIVKSQKRFSLYCSVGAKPGDIAGAMLLESLFIFLVGLALGAAVDTVIYAAMFSGDELRQGLVYYQLLDGKIFLQAAGWTLLLPAAALFVVLLFRMNKKRISVRG